MDLSRADPLGNNPNLAESWSTDARPKRSDQTAARVKYHDGSLNGARRGVELRQADETDAPTTTGNRPDRQQLACLAAVLSGRRLHPGDHDEGANGITHELTNVFHVESGGNEVIEMAEVCI
jgi:hypothetical protein